jgi:deoxyribodipyrimidine photo-lyase
MTPVLVWFKRDLRVADHEALHAAATEGPVIPLYVVEPGYWRCDFASGRQFQFLRESLCVLDQSLTKCGQPLWAAVGEIEEVLSRLYQRFGFKTMHSHQETGPGWTFERDRRVKHWCVGNGICWIEHRQHGVIRGLNGRSQWASRWSELMDAPCIPEPIELQGVGLPPKSATEVLSGVEISSDPIISNQPGGLVEGSTLLNSFLLTRAAAYRGGISSPLSAVRACSRLSPHLSLGTLSLREVWQKSQVRRDVLVREGGQGGFSASLKSFGSRLHWHCHFMQKLESEPRLEFEELHRGFIGLRQQNALHLERFERMALGQLGWPFVDACLRCLRQTGWINFRMRAMLVAIASYHLWIDWRHTGALFARWFTDFEAGIHFSQLQMQSGTTGINANRIYSPLKQSEDQDPDGIFIRQWVPELKNVPTLWIHKPWKMPVSQQHRIGCLIGRDYPSPIGDPAQLAREAKDCLKRWIEAHDLRSESQRVLKQHGSRRKQHLVRYGKKYQGTQMMLEF